MNIKEAIIKLRGVWPYYEDGRFEVGSEHLLVSTRANKVHGEGVFQGVCNFSEVNSWLYVCNKSQFDKALSKEFEGCPEYATHKDVITGVYYCISGDLLLRYSKSNNVDDIRKVSKIQSHLLPYMVSRPFYLHPPAEYTSWVDIKDGEVYTVSNVMNKDDEDLPTIVVCIFSKSKTIAVPADMWSCVFTPKVSDRHKHMADLISIIQSNCGMTNFELAELIEEKLF